MSTISMVPVPAEALHRLQTHAVATLKASQHAELAARRLGRADLAAAPRGYPAALSTPGRSS